MTKSESVQVRKKACAGNRDLLFQSRDGFVEMSLFFAAVSLLEHAVAILQTLTKLAVDIFAEIPIPHFSCYFSVSAQT